MYVVSAYRNLNITPFKRDRWRREGDFFLGRGGQGLIVLLWPVWNLLCRPGWLRGHRHTPASASQVLGLKTCTILCSWAIFLKLTCLADDDWQEAHERLAELEEKLPVAADEQTGNGERDEMDLLGDHEENLAERLSKMVIENELEDPAIMRAVQTRPVLQVSYSDLGTHNGSNNNRLIIKVLSFVIYFLFNNRIACSIDSGSHL